MNMQGLSDQQLMGYINQVFMRYDRDNSGGLDAVQLANFYTDLYRCFGYNIQMTYQQASQALSVIDKNFDGRASRQQLFLAFKLMIGQQNTYVSCIQPIPNFQYNPNYVQYVQQPVYYQQGYIQQPIYGQQNMYGQQYMYGQNNFNQQQGQFY